jgi:phospholipase C
MLENRAFDHMLGFLKKVNPKIEGLNGNETNPYDPTNPNSPVVQVNDNAPYVDPNPGHTIPGNCDKYVNSTPV